MHACRLLFRAGFVQRGFLPGSLCILISLACLLPLQGAWASDARFVSQSVPSILTAGQSYPVSVTLRNTGDAPWSVGDFSLGSQNPQDNTTWGLNRVDLPNPVDPGEEVTFTFTVSAPATPGIYDFQWQMVQEGDQEWFGDLTDNVSVTVNSPGRVLAYVTNWSSDTVSVIDTTTNEVTATISLPEGSNPFGLTLTPDGTRLYVANSRSNTVAVIDTATNTVVATVPNIAGAAKVVITPEGTKAYVTEYNGSAVSVIDTAINTVVARIPIMAALPSGITISPDGSRVYVGNFSYEPPPVPDPVAVIDTATDTVIASIPVPFTPETLAITPDGTKVYAGYDADDRIAVIDTATNRVSGTINDAGPSDGIAVSPDGLSAYMGGEENDRVVVIDTGIDAIVNTIPTGYSGEGVAFTPDGERLYITGRGPVINVIDTSTVTIVATIPVGGFPRGVAIGLIP